jgi:hypothetical protein
VTGPLVAGKNEDQLQEAGQTLPGGQCSDLLDSMSSNQIPFNG